MKKFVLRLIDTRNTDQETPSPAKATRGPKPVVTLNPLAPLIRVAASRSMPFIEDAVMTGIYIAVGSNNGTLNARPRHVQRAIGMDVISTAHIQSLFCTNHGTPISERTARYIAGAARVALGKIRRLFERTPALVNRLEGMLADDKRWELDCELDDWVYGSGPEWDTA